MLTISCCTESTRDDDNEDDDEYTPGSETDSGGSSDDSMSETPPPKKLRKTKQGSGKARRKLKPVKLKPVKHTPVLLESNELRRTSLLEDLDVPSTSKPWEVPSMLAAIKKNMRDAHKVLVALGHLELECCSTYTVLFAGR